MYKLAKNRIIIEKAVDIVFNYAANLDNFAVWFPGVISTTSVNTLNFTEKGKKYKESFSSLGSKKKVIIEVKDCAPLNYLITESEYLPILPRMEMVFTKIDEGQTEVTWTMFSRNGGLTWMLLMPLVKLVMNSRSKKGLRQLRDIMLRK